MRTALLAAVLLTACAPVHLTLGVVPPSPPGPQAPRPDGTPDVIILGVSGHCHIPCDPADNWDYLTPRGTLEAVAEALRAEGLTVQTEGFSSHLTTHRSKLSGREERGFLQLEELLLRAHAEFVWGRLNPTRIVLVAHSHGVVWTHQLARLHPEITVDTMIDLDGFCDVWERDNAAMVRQYMQGAGANRWRLDPSDPCGSVRVGPARLDVKDVVFPNVRVNLEVQSQRLGGRTSEPGAGPFGANFPFDLVRNVRTDGSRAGIHTLYVRDENHSWVTVPGGPSMTWVTSKLRDVARGWALDKAQ